MIELQLADHAGLDWAQRQVSAHHYLHKPVDDRCSPLAYLVRSGGLRVGCLIFGRPEATCCYDPKSKLTYGSYEDVQAGRCQYDRWELVNLARVWLDPIVQRSGFCYVPHAASTAIKTALARVGYDYLVAHPPVDCTRPYQLRVCLSYCDMVLHNGYLYRICRFKHARTNRRGIATFMKGLGPLSSEQDTHIHRLAEQSPRSRQYRARRHVAMKQLAFEVTS